MQTEKRFTMLSPRAGFTNRVMARIAEHERAQARRRAMIGSILLLAFAFVVVTLIGVWLASWVVAFVSMPQMIDSIFGAAVTLVFWISVAFDGIVTALGAIAANIGVAQMSGLAIAVVALTALWVRVVIGSGLSSQTMIAGG